MFSREVKRLIFSFNNNASGEFALQSALMFGALAVLGTLLAVPLLDNATRHYAESRSLGIDPITTASTTKRNQNSNRYIIRRSILNEGETIICHNQFGKKC